MDLMPTSPLSPVALFTRSIQLYSQTFVSTLPYVLVIIGLHYLIGVLPYFPFISVNNELQIAFMGASILLLPIVGGFFNYQREMLSGRPALLPALMNGFSYIIPLMLAIVYIAFIPLILMSLSILGYFFLDPGKISLSIRLSILFGGIALTCLFLRNKLFSLILIFTEKLDAISAQEKCDKLTSGFYLRTFIFGFLPMAIGIYLFWIPTIMRLMLPERIKMDFLVYQGMGDAILGVIGPWMSMLLLLYLNDLQLRKQDTLHKEQKTNEQQYKDAALKAKSPTDENML